MLHATVAERIPPATPINPRALRDCFGKFATGVTVVACRNEHGDPHGATISSFTSISMDPALLQVTLIRDNKIARLIKNSPFTVSVLAADQQELAVHFAGRPQGVTPRWVEGATAPALGGASAVFSCRPWAEYDGGDHIIVIGEVVDAKFEDREPLLFHGGKFHRLGEPSSPARPSRLVGTQHGAVRGGQTATTTRVRTAS